MTKKVYNLGRSIAQIVPFQVTKQIVEHKEIITTKLVIIMLIIVIAKIAILLTL